MDQPYLWWRDGVIYQIYPRSFQDSTGDGIGDLNGITSRLDYLAELGVDALWLSPINPSPDVDFGYDVADYKAIDPKFGSMEDFKRLMEEAHKRGIRIVLDLVLNHTSDQHPWFVQSRSSRENPYRDWYLWRDPAPDGGRPNNWESVFGGPGWELDPTTQQYYFHMFYKQQPDLNWRNPQVRQEMLDVFRFWADLGVDGFRLDVFNAYFKRADFASNPPNPRLGIRAFDRQLHVNDIDQPEMLPLLGEIRSLLDSYPERYAVGETFLDGGGKAGRYSGKNLLHGTFNFEMLRSRWSPVEFLNAIQRWEGSLSPDAWPTNVLNNHDTPRSATRYGRGENDERLKVAAALLLTLRGTPFLYAGEELGMRDIRIRRSMIVDPIGKRYWPIMVGRDGCRAPMQWDATPNAGFSRGKPWLPVHPDYQARNAAAQRSQPDSLYNFYRRLIHLRRELPALRSGMFQALTLAPRSILAYLRQTNEQQVLVGLNFSRRRINLVLGQELARAGWKLLLSNKRSELSALRDGMLLLEGEEALVMVRI